MSGMDVTGTVGTLMDWGPTAVGKEKTQDWISAQWIAEKLQDEYDKAIFYDAWNRQTTSHMVCSAGILRQI